ncbi:MAG: PDZ domain-containing protein [Planctomycetes bacterium]|nr:PDZ domain-containing protein [Planctomycetota bacterium]
MRGLRYALEQALEAHRVPPKPAERLNKPFRAEDFAAAKRFKGGCIHCHNVNEFQRADLKSEGKWRREDIWVYPLPENVGLTLDVDVGNLVKSVQADSPAAKVGVKPGDYVKMLNGNPVASFADASYGLHKSPIKGEIPIAWLHEGKEQTAKLVVGEGWRKTNLTWRPSMLDILPSLPLSGDDLKPEEKKALGIAENRLGFRQDKFVHSTLKVVGVMKDDVVIGVDGKEMMGTMDDFLGYVRRNYLVGDQIFLNLMREGKRLDVMLKLR